jgi:hypothetical protein
MVFDPIWETMQGSSGVTHSDILGDNRTDPANDAFCERARYRRHFPMSGVGISMDDSISCGCELCRLYYTMYCLARIGPGLWRMDRGEVKARLLKFEKKGPSDCIMHTFGSSVWEMCNGKLGEENLQYFLIEGMHHLPIQEKPLLILLQHAYPCKAYLFPSHFLNLLVLMKAFGLRRSGWNTV